MQPRPTLAPHDLTVLDGFITLSRWDNKGKREGAELRHHPFFPSWALYSFTYVCKASFWTHITVENKNVSSLRVKTNQLHLKMPSVFSAKPKENLHLKEIYIKTIVP